MPGKPIGTALRRLEEEVWSGYIEIIKDGATYSHRIQGEKGTPEIVASFKQSMDEFVRKLNEGAGER